MGKPKKYFTEEERKAAHREALKRYRERHLDEERESNKRYRQENPDKERERHKRWQAENPEKVREKNKRWSEKNPEKWRAANLISTYRQRDKNANRGECTLTTEWVMENIFTKPCHYCGKEGWDVIGCDRIDNSRPHTPDNVVPCCAECNKKRSSKSYEEFYDSRRIQQTEAIQ